jgi:hypothetical protein
LPTLSDPALFALPRPQGFSVLAWLSFPPPEHRLTDWKESAHWLALNPMWLGDSFAALAATSVIEPMLIAEKPLPRPTGLDVPIPNEPLATESELRIEGELAHRSLLAPLDLPGFSSPEPLTNTIVQLLVDAAGRPLTATLLVESGSMLVERGSKDAANEADQHAMRQATAARFEPLRYPNGMPQPDPRLSWGKLVFQWATLPPAATNSVAAQP